MIYWFKLWYNICFNIEIIRYNYIKIKYKYYIIIYENKLYKN